jgi:transcriptional regulator with XRE-family HTH domain
MPRRPPSVRARGLGAELRDLRADCKLTSRAVAERLGWSASTLSRLENGLRGISVEDVASLLVVYKVTGAERERLLEQAREADRPDWWAAGGPGLPPGLTALIGFESQAARITNVEMLLVPGLLQTPDYIRGVMASAGLASHDAEARVAARLGRQAILSRPDPPELQVLLDEGALRRPVGGAAVLAAQLRYLIAVAARPSITLRVLPIHLGAHPGTTGSFVLFEFDRARPVVHLEHRGAGTFVDEAADTAPFAAARDALASLALSPATSCAVIADLADELERKR